MRQAGSTEAAAPSTEDKRFWASLTAHEHYAKAKRAAACLAVAGIAGFITVGAAEIFISHFKVAPVGTVIPTEHNGSIVHIPPPVDPCLATYRAEIKLDPENNNLGSNVANYQRCEEERKNHSEALETFGLVTTTSTTEAGLPPVTVRPQS